MPTATVVAVPVRCTVPAATGLVVPVHPLLALAISGPVSAGAPLVAALVDPREIEQRGRIRRPLNRYEKPTDDCPVRPRPALPPFDGRGDLLREGLLLPRRGSPFRGHVAH